ncbi:MAG: preprotein translocase subunit SecG [Candidatus Omnitrophota bacterium]
MMLYGFVIFIHVTACIVLILVILFQAGRGGGLAEPLGGSSTKTIFGTKAAMFLTRATSVCAIVYIFTCLLLGVLTTRKSRSLIGKETFTQMPSIPAQPSDPLDDSRQPPVSDGGAPAADTAVSAPEESTLPEETPAPSER